VTVQSTSQASCHPDAGGIDAGADNGPDYGDTMNGAEGDDDDCKYHVKWTSAPVCESSGGVTFTLTATNKSDGTPLVGAGTVAEIFLSDTHPGPNTGVTLTESSPGTYAGPIQFDAPGKWTVRFHFHGECEDLFPDSPHGHAAFYVNVP
jgi:hypothetical protein